MPETIPITDCRRFVKESVRVLKTPGLLLVQDHVLPEDPAVARYVDRFERLRDPSHNRAFSQNDLKSKRTLCYKGLRNN
ncbi:MAG: hypothetical protein MUP74_00360 [Desulfobacterales bacterium]|nr:hypothetical protein [Desulfobacterales bacterium]